MIPFSSLWLLGAKPNQEEVLERLWIHNLSFLYMVHRQEDLTIRSHVLSDCGNLKLCWESMHSQFHWHRKKNKKDATEMPTGVSLSPDQSLELFSVIVATWPQNLTTIILLFIILWSRHSSRDQQDGSSLLYVVSTGRHNWRKDPGWPHSYVW